jgi:hypothetical protein
MHGPATPSPANALRRLICGYQVTFLIQVAAELNLADLLADGLRSCDDLAVVARCDPNALRRVLFALAELGILVRATEGRFGLTPLGACLRSNHPDGLNAFARYQGHAMVQRPWSKLLHTVRTGETAFDAIFGCGLFEYFDSHPDAAELFTAGMATRTAEHLDTIVAAYDWTSFRTIVDVGGADGLLLTSVLATARDARGVIFDQERNRSAAEQRIASAGMQRRCIFVHGDFFAAVPGGGDAYLLKYVLHDWNDDQVVTILRNVRHTAPVDARLLVIEPLLPQDGTPALEAAIMDVAMLAVTGGRERTEDEFATLYKRAGFRLNRILPTTSPFCLVEGLPT